MVETVQEAIATRWGKHFHYVTDLGFIIYKDETGSYAVFSL